MTEPDPSVWLVVTSLTVNPSGFFSPANCNTAGLQRKNAAGTLYISSEQGNIISPPVQNDDGVMSSRYSPVDKHVTLTFIITLKALSHLPHHRTWF